MKSPRTGRRLSWSKDEREWERQVHAGLWESGDFVGKRPADLHRSCLGHPGNPAGVRGHDLPMGFAKRGGELREPATPWCTEDSGHSPGATADGKHPDESGADGSRGNLVKSIQSADGHCPA
nr:hypothetical protein [Acidithiobacillus ferrivorans]